jgi:hypothetical protein
MRFSLGAVAILFIGAVMFFLSRGPRRPKSQ